jgi:hypothetical protein
VRQISILAFQLAPMIDLWPSVFKSCFVTSYVQVDHLLFVCTSSKCRFWVPIIPKK